MIRLKNYYNEIELTTDQETAVEQIETFLQSESKVFILKGYAGSGKTTLLKGVAEYLNDSKKRFELMAPTGRAAKVIREKTGFEAHTIHKSIYSFDELVEVDNKNAVGKSSSFLYQFKIRKNLEDPSEVIIVDEASMISDTISESEFFRFGSGRLLYDLVRFSNVNCSHEKSKILFIGDPAQLPPVGMNHSPALEDEYFKKNFKIECKSVELKEVKRQSSDNKILQRSSHIRKCLTASYFNDFDLTPNDKDLFNLSYDEYISKYFELESPKQIITFKNKTSSEINNSIREAKYGANKDIQSSDIVINGKNNYAANILNGEFAVVIEASKELISRNIVFNLKGGEKQSVQLIWRHITLMKDDDEVIKALMLENYLNSREALDINVMRALYVDFKNRNPKLKVGSVDFKDAIKKDDYFNALMLKYGYSVTCHKAQGGEWSNVIIYWDKGVNSMNSNVTHHGKSNADFYRWAYTAITRASEKLYSIEPPHFSPFSDMTYVNHEIQKALNEVIHKREPHQYHFSDIKELFSNFNLENSSRAIQNHFVLIWHNLKSIGINIQSWRKVGFEIRYTVIHEDQTVGLKFWMNSKDQFKSSFQKLPKSTNSNELFEIVSQRIHNADPVSIVYEVNNQSSIMDDYKFDPLIEEDKPFLKSLFDKLSGLINQEVKIANIEHLDFRERYTFKTLKGDNIVDFEYNKKGFFGRVVPSEKKCQDQEFVQYLSEIVEQLKKM